MVRTNRYFVGFLAIFLLLGLPLRAQERKGTITGHATDVNHDSLVGARVELQPLGRTATTDGQGQFTISEVMPGKYTLTVSYVGFKPFSREVTIASVAWKTWTPCLRSKR